MKVLHIASFNGNIGDYANHKALHTCFKKYVDEDAQFTCVEMREFYSSWGIRHFDDEFVKLANSHDLLILGGGNFFDLGWDYSHTGTTIDLSDDIIESLKCKVLVCAMGFSDRNEVNQKNVCAFNHFLNNILSRKNWKVSLRNDGSLAKMRKYVEKSLTEKIIKIPDHGFSYMPERRCPMFEFPTEKTVGINICADAISSRFKDKNAAEKFFKQISEVITEFLHQRKDYSVVFFPHIYSDMECIVNVIKGIPDTIRRTRLTVAPLVLANNSSVDNVFDLYKRCEFAVSMRFHANVCPISMEVPTIGISTNGQIEDLYEEIGLPERCINAYSGEINESLFKMMSETAENIVLIKQRYAALNVALRKQHSEFHADLKEWLNNLNK